MLPGQPHCGVDRADSAEVVPPNPEIVPEVKTKTAPSGRPVLMVKKTPFQGYTVKVARGSAPAVDAGFSSSRDYEVPLPLPLPAPGTAEVWTVQVQYRYQNAPFGQWSQPVEITVRGV